MMSKGPPRTRGVINWDCDYASARWIATRKRLQPVKPLEVPITRRLQLQKLFETLDLDSGGSIDADEILEAVALVNESAIDMPLDGNELMEKFQQLDETGEGLVKLDKFLHVMTLDLRKKEFFELAEEQGQSNSTSDFSDFANLYEREMIIKKVEDKSAINALEQYNLFMTLFQVDVAKNKSGDAEVMKLMQEKKTTLLRKAKKKQRAREAVEWLQANELRLKPRKAAAQAQSLSEIEHAYAPGSPLRMAVDTLLPYSTATGSPSRAVRASRLRPRVLSLAEHHELPSRIKRGPSAVSLDTLPAAPVDPVPKPTSSGAVPSNLASISPHMPPPSVRNMGKPKVIFGSRTMNKVRPHRPKLRTVAKSQSTPLLTTPALRS